MIKSKKDYYDYLFCDKVALGTKKRPSLLPYCDSIWKFERLLRKNEYYNNCKKTIFGKIPSLVLKMRYKSLSQKLGFSIPFNAFGAGLSIAHYGTIVVNSKARIGKNCRIQECVNIGTTSGSTNAPIIGKNVFIGTGAKIIGDIRIGDDACIGAGAVVVRDVPDGVIVGGVPAKVISNNNSHNNLKKQLFEEGLI